MVSLIAALAFAPSVSLGEYRLDMGTEWRRLRLVSRGYFEYQSGGCFHRESSEGQYFVSRDRIVFDPPLDVNFDKKGAGELQIVRWGKATLLVPKHELLSLGAMAKGTDGPERVASSFFRIPAAVKGLTGSPQLPKPFDQIEKRSQAFRVLLVEGKRATIDGGTRDGLLPGTALLSGSEKTLLIGVVRRCSEGRAEVGWLSLGSRGTLEPGAPFEIANEEGLLLGRALAPTLLDHGTSHSGSDSDLATP